MSQFGFFFYPGDWLKDTRALDPFSRGLWIDTLCLLNEHGGEITWPIVNLAQFLGIEVPTCDAFVRLLSRLNTADICMSVTDEVTIACRRMVRERKKRESNRLRKEKERERKARHRKITDQSQKNHASLNLNPSSYKRERGDKERDPSLIPKPLSQEREPTGSVKSRGNGKGREINPEVSIFLKWWSERYLTVMKQDYLVQWGKEGKLTKELLATRSLEEIKRRAERLLSINDRWLRSHRTIGVLFSHWNELGEVEGEDGPTLPVL